MKFKIKEMLSGFVCLALATFLFGCSQTPSAETNGVQESSSHTVEEILVSSDQAEPPESSQEQDSSSKGAESPEPSSSESSQSPSSVMQTVKITFPEGSTVARIFDLLEEKGVAKKADLFIAMDKMDYSAYPLVQAILPKSNERCFLLEGYLYASTYEFYIGENPENVLKRFLEQSEKRITKEYRSQAESLGYSMDDMLILASILEKEVHKQSELATVSSIFHNRLAKGQKLQSDATIKYVEGAIKPYIDGDINRYNSFYNTYKCKALPAGAICNPSMKALEAALNPAQTEYLFFATDSQGNYFYSQTYEEHVAVVDGLE